MISGSQLLAGSIALLACLTLARATLVDPDKPGVVGRCGYIFYDDYEPKEIDRLSQIPESIRTILMKHLHSRLGDAGLARLQFDGGQVVNKKKLLRVDPDAKDYQWPIPTYQLFFLFLMTEQPRVTYCAEIQLDENGGVIREIDLPFYAKTPEKLHIVPVSRALEVAVREGMPRNALGVEAGYASEFDSLEWLVSKWTRSQGSAWRVTTLHVVAHDANKIAWSETEADE
jgi:hypothetical protein